MRRVFAWLNESIFKTVFHHLCGSRLLMRLLGFKMPPLRTSIGFGGVYGDLTTFLLGRKLRTLIPERDVRRAHEIGVGPWGTLSIYVRKRFPHVAQSASTIAPVEVENAGCVARMNGVSFNIIESDVLNSVPGEFDLIWWNLPYYEADVDEFIDRLFRQVHEKRSIVPGGVVMLGFNGIPLPLERVRALAAKHPHMTVLECKTYAWNPHVLFIAEHRPVPQSKNKPAGADVAGAPASVPPPAASATLDSAALTGAVAILHHNRQAHLLGEPRSEKREHG